jgi:hypothetical protein
MDSCNPRLFLKSGTPEVDGCSLAIVHVSSLFLFLFFLYLADSTYRPPSLYSLMRIIGCSMSVIPHAGKIHLEMLTVDSHWELDTVQLLKHICISGQDLVNSIRPMPI